MQVKGLFFAPPQVPTQTSSVSCASEDVFEECFEELIQPNKGASLTIALPKTWVDQHPEVEWDEVSRQVKLPVGWSVAIGPKALSLRTLVFNEKGEVIP